MFGRILLLSHLVVDFAGSWSFVCFYKFNFITSNQSVQIFSFFLVVLQGCIALEIYPFLLGCPIWWHKTVILSCDFFNLSEVSLELNICHEKHCRAHKLKAYFQRESYPTMLSTFSMRITALQWKKINFI